MIEKISDHPTVTKNRNKINEIIEKVNILEEMVIKMNTVQSGIMSAMAGRFVEPPQSEFSVGEDDGA